MANPIVFPVGVIPTRHYTRTQDTGTRVMARLTSLDSGASLWFRLAPAEHQREYGASWENVDVCESDPRPSEYRHTTPERRTYQLVLDAYARPGGHANSLEGELRTLKSFTKRAPGKVRAHRCIYTQGEQIFGPCFVEKISVKVMRINDTGGALQAYDVSLELVELPGSLGFQVSSGWIGRI